MKSPLLDKKIFITPIQLDNVSGIFKDAKYEASMYSETKRSLVTPINTKGYIIDPLTKEEKEFFTKELNISFDVYKDPLTCFWSTEQARLTFEKKGMSAETAGVTLDLNDTIDYLLYKMALSNPRVAKNWKDRFNPNFEFVIKDLDSEEKEEIDFGKMRLDVMSYIVENKSNYKALYDLLRLYTGASAIKKKVGQNNSTEWLASELGKLVENKRSVTVLYELLKLNPAELSLKIFIEDAIEVGAIRKKGNEFEIEGVETPFYQKSEVADFINDKKNQAIKLRIKSLIEKK
jgi:hypothetical protein